jgi:riboflavin kinase/FMN adenylyltransferase
LAAGGARFPLRRAARGRFFDLAEPRISPIAGIFVVEVDRYGRGVASVGRRPTINPVAIPLLEVHLFDHDEDLYGEHLRVRFLKKLRDEAKYDGLPELQAAIARDARQAREFFLKHG